MRIAIVCSNLFNISQETPKGTEIFCDDLINNLAQNEKRNTFDITAFASGESHLPVKIESVDFKPTSADPEIIENGKHVNFELELISKAFMQQDNFDLFHINIGDGDIALPFVPFVHKPVLITLHNTINADFTRKYFSMSRNLKNVFFFFFNNFHGKVFPDLNYAATIHHGVDGNIFGFGAEGGSNIVWAGRAIPSKGMDLAVELARRCKLKIKLFAIRKDDHGAWLETVLKQIKSQPDLISIEFDQERASLVGPFQKSKLFLFPIVWDEPFGLVLAESLACGTPVVAYARGSVPEIIKDGETGYIVNSSEEDMRGNWIIKKTGVEGLCEAVEKIYSMPEGEYKKMRKACRDRFEKNFTIEKMTKEYERVYQKIVLQ